MHDLSVKRGAVSIRTICGSPSNMLMILALQRSIPPINLVRLKRMFKTLMTGLTVTISSSIPLSVRLCRCASWETSRPPSTKIAGKELEVVAETKLLGLTVQSNLSWDMQVDSMVGKSSCRLYMLNHLKRFGLPEEDLVSVFVSYVRPVVEYATPVWHGCLTEEQYKKLEIIQKCE